MNLVNFFLSAGPIFLLIWLMTKRNAVPSHIALPLTALVVLVIQLLYWGNTFSSISASLIVSFLSALVPVSIVFGAILFNRFIEESGAIIVIKSWLASITPNPTAQLMIISWAFAFMIEGASGFGTPPAIAAPLLVSLGFRPLPVAILALIMNSVPVSFGAVGTPTWYGFSPIELTGSQPFDSMLGFKTALLHSSAALVVPVMALAFVVSWKEIRKNIIFIYLSILSCCVPYFVIAIFNNEFPALVGGAIGLIISVVLAKFNVGIAKDFDESECRIGSVKQSFDTFTNRQVFKAFLPFVLLIAVLILTRIKQLPLKHLLDNKEMLVDFNLGFAHLEFTQSLTMRLTHIFGTGVGDEFKLLYTPAIIPFVLIVLLLVPFYSRVKGKTTSIFVQTASSLKLTYVAIYGAFVMVKLMMLEHSNMNGIVDIESMVNTIGNVFSYWLGDLWLYFASYLGAIGIFFSGSNTVSNLTFGSIQYSISHSIATSPSTILALQSVGGAYGSMVCINNIIAVCSVVNISNKEGYILKCTFKPMLAYGAVVAVVAVGCGLVFPEFWINSPV